METSSTGQLAFRQAVFESGHKSRKGRLSWFGYNEWMVRLDYRAVLKYSEPTNGGRRIFDGRLQQRITDSGRYHQKCKTHNFQIEIATPIGSASCTSESGDSDFEIVWAQGFV